MRRLKNSFVMFFVFTFTLNMAANFAHPVTPMLIKGMDLSDYTFGLAFAAMSFTSFFFSPLFGQLATYISSKYVLLICGLGYSLGQLFFLMAHTTAQFVLARTFAGIFIGGTYVSMLTYIVNTSPEHKRGSYLAINVTLQSLSTAFGFFTGGMLGKINIYVPLWTQVATLAGSTLLLMPFMKDDRNANTTMPSRKELIQAANPFSALIKCGKYLSPLLLIAILYTGFSSIGFTAFDQSFNYYLCDQFGLTSEYNGIIKAILGIISLVSNSTICLWILKRRNTSKYMVPVMAICTLSMLGVVVFTNIVPFVIVNVLFFAFYYIMLPLTQDIVALHSTNENRNLIMGAYNGIKSFGNIFGALFSGFMYEANARLPFIFGLGAYLIATLLTVIYRKKEHA